GYPLELQQFQHLQFTQPSALPRQTEQGFWGVLAAQCKTQQSETQQVEGFAVLS
ncbi:MAG: hypothetical protein HC772_04720, partial [Leptolyngbyaceae cyanobacterium CRU_2_3]|nr:hypothetical protein [Leptolyngbyaceae cyanobacterium CRU_2_3]